MFALGWRIVVATVQVAKSCRKIYYFLFVSALQDLPERESLIT
jgi:hypothetical protein